MYSNNNPFSFLSGSVENCQIARVITQIDQIKNAGASDSRILKYVISEKQWYSFDLEWQATKLSDDLVYICGQMGVILRGHDNQWETIEQNVTTNDFWGMEWYNDKLYLACDSGLFTLSEGVIEPVVMGIENVTCHHLHANDGLLWSFGPKHVCYSEDGIKWNDVTP